MVTDQHDRYHDWFDNNRRLKHLIAPLEALSLTILAEAEGWNHKGADET